MAKYIDPFTDTGFKIVFGLNNVSNEILKYFLNALFEGQPDFEEIVSVRYLNNENVREWIEGRPLSTACIARRHMGIVSLSRCRKTHRRISLVVQYTMSLGQSHIKAIREIFRQK